MKTPAIKATMFIVGGLLAIAGWHVFTPEMKDTEVLPAPEPPEEREALWQPEQWQPLIVAVEAAGSYPEKMAAAERLNRIPVANVREALEGCELVRDRKLTLAARILLVRWAAADGEAATLWAWERVRSQGRWPEAFTQTGQAWAWKDPERFGRWALGLAKDKKSPDAMDLQHAQLAPDAAPQLTFGMRELAARWLLQDQPRMAYQMMRARGGGSSTDINLAQQLTTLAQVKEGLMAFEDQGDLMKARYWTPARDHKDLALRWKELDPASYAQSPYASLIQDEPPAESSPLLDGWDGTASGDRQATASRLYGEARAELQPSVAVRVVQQWASEDTAACLAWVDTLPAIPRQKGWVTAFDVWRKSHPGAVPDFTGWPADRREAWEDLMLLEKAE